MTPDDLDAVTALARLSLPLDPITREVIEEKTLGDPYFAADASFVATVEGAMAGCAPVSLIAHGRPTAYVKFFATHPCHRQRGVATALFDALEEAGAQLGAVSVRPLDEPANYLMPGVDPRYTAAHCFLERRGYRRDAERVNLAADLLRLPGDLAERRARLKAAHGIDVRRAEPKDEPAVMALLERHWPGWQYEVGNTFRNMPVTTFAAWDGERVVGFSSYEGNNRGTGWFGPMGTDPDYRARGIGEICCLLCLEGLRAQGHRRAVIPWVGPVRFYARVCGAEIDRVFWAYEKPLAPPGESTAATADR